MNDIPAAKIKMMTASLRCLVLGLLGLMPIIGLPFALAALWFAGVVRTQEKLLWNPARHQRVLGTACAACGAVTWSVVDTFLIFQAFNCFINA